ncbi:ABC transporter permease [Streptomyces sp. NPDC091266]|uniref:ABC transporter permease n=1 Tax=Streptomyces sp. NPDC091266 TaxID=3365978 RepID=UPI00382270E8
MRHQWSAFTVALGFTLTSHLRNRLAMSMIAFFIPTWIYLVRVTALDKDITFHSTLGIEITASMNRTIQVSSALHAVTVIAGFMMFMATFNSRGMDQRLVLAGYPRLQLLAAKLVSLLVMTALLTGYTTGLLRMSWPLAQPGAVAAALAAAILAYGGLGLMAGYLLRGELEGFFVVVMATLIDVGMQSPVSNPAGNQPGLSMLPLYGPAQAALAASFTPGAGLTCAARALPCFLATSLMALAIFCWRTRHYGRPSQVPESPGLYRQASDAELTATWREGLDAPETASPR